MLTHPMTHAKNSHKACAFRRPGRKIGDEVLSQGLRRRSTNYEQK